MKENYRYPGYFALLLTAALFGLAFIFQRHSAGSLSALHFMSWRLLVSALFLGGCAGVIHCYKPKLSYGHWRRDGSICGLLMFLGMFTQQWGLAHTTAGKSGFITGLYVVLVPLFGLCLGQRPGKTVQFALLLAVAGLVCFAGIQHSDRLLVWNIGDSVTLVSALCWAWYVLFLGYAVRCSDVLAVSVMQLIIVALLSVFSMSLTEGLAPLLDKEKWAFSQWDILFTGIGSSAIAFFMQAWGQRTVPATHAAIILSLESVFALLFGWLFLHESITGRMLIGCLLMLAAMLVAQFDDIKYVKTSHENSC